MDSVIAFAVIMIPFAVLWWNERNFLARAQTYFATVLRLYIQVNTTDRNFEDDTRQIAPKATVELIQSVAEKRTGDITVPLELWPTIQIGDTIQVLAYPDHPKWVFWTPMIRAKHGKFYLRMFAALTIIFFTLSLVSIYWN